MKCLSQGLLDENVQNQQTAIKSAQTTAQQSASVSQEKLLKYIGQNQMASGVAAGQRGSDYINANCLCKIWMNYSLATMYIHNENLMTKLFHTYYTLSRTKVIIMIIKVIIACFISFLNKI